MKYLIFDSLLPGKYLFKIVCGTLCVMKLTVFGYEDGFNTGGVFYKLICFVKTIQKTDR